MRTVKKLSVERKEETTKVLHGKAKKYFRKINRCPAWPGRDSVINPQQKVTFNPRTVKSKKQR